MAEHRLKPTHLKFVENYLKTGNASKAYAMINPDAKNPDDNAMQLLKRKSVQELIMKAQSQSIANIQVTFDEKVNHLMAIIVRCMKENEIDEESGIIIEHFKPEVVIRAIAELNKMQGHYAPEKHVVVNIEGTVDKIRELKIEYDKY
jgi:phage terminase small subunit